MFDFSSFFFLFLFFQCFSSVYFSVKNFQVADTFSIKFFLFWKKKLYSTWKKKSTSSNNFSKKAFLKISSISNSNNEAWILYRVLLRNDSQAVSENFFLVLSWLWINGNWCRFKTRCVFINRYSVITDWTKWTGNTYPWKSDVINVLSTGILQMEEVHLLAYRKYFSCL